MPNYRLFSLLQIVIIDTVTMALGEERGLITAPQTCKSHNYDVMKPIVLATWKHSFQGGCPDKSAILAESQVYRKRFPSNYLL